METAREAAVLVVQLDEEQFLQFHAVLSLLPLLLAFGVMHGAQGCVAVHQMVFRHDACRKGLCQRPWQLREEGVDYTRQEFGRDAFGLAFLGGMVDGEELVVALLLVEAGGLDVGMHHLQDPVVQCGLAHHEIHHARLQLVLYPFQSVEPGEHHLARAVEKGSLNPRRAAVHDGVEVAYHATEDDVGLVGVEIVDRAHFRAVENPEGEIHQHVAACMYIQLFAKEFSTGGADAFEV